MTIDRLHELLNYAPKTGLFTWAQKRRGCRIGDVAGCKMRNGYIVIRLDGKLYLAHRLAWLYIHGQWPTAQLDHINQNRADNRLENLREVSNAENAQNRKKMANKSGFTGVRRENSKWVAEIKVNYTTKRLGLYNSPEEAHAAYVNAKKRFHPFSPS